MKQHHLLLLGILFLISPQCISQDNQSIYSSKQTYDWAWMYLRGDVKDKKLEKQFQLIKDSGIDGLLILLRGEPMEEFAHKVKIAKKVGLSVHVWIPTTKIHGGRNLEKEHPEWFQVSRESISCLEKPPYIPSYKWLCPNREGAREYLIEEMRSLAKMEFLDGVHLDYIRFPDVILPVGIQPKYDLNQDKEYPEFDFCYCDVCREKFKQEHGIDPMDIEDPANNKDWVEFRYNSITNLVNDIYDVVHAEGKMLSAAVFPTPKLAKQLVRQDWVNWKIDALMPMIYHEYYFEPLSWVGQAAKEGVDALNGKIPFYSGIFTVWIDAEEMDDVVEYSKQAGAQGICLFNANKMSKKQWKELGKALNKQ